MTTTDPRVAVGDVSAAEFRHAIGHFATGVTIVTSVGIDGEPVGTTANAVSSLSLDPPLILVCFDVGAVLFVNGLLFLGRIDGKGAGTFNLFVGALQVAIPFYLIATAPTASDILLDAGIFLFGFTYLYVGISNLAGQSLVGLGWYSAWVAIMAAAFGITNIVKFHDPTIGLLWLQWSVLWALFFLVLALGMTRLTAMTGWLTLILSFTTCTVPGFLLLLGDWGHIPVWAVLVVMAATVAAVLPVGLRSLRTAPEVPEQAEAGVPVSVS